jgi:hypothetical protein
MALIPGGNAGGGGMTRQMSFPTPPTHRVSVPVPGPSGAVREDTEHVIPGRTPGRCANPDVLVGVKQSVLNAVVEIASLRS